MTQLSETSGTSDSETRVRFAQMWARMWKWTRQRWAQVPPTRVLGGRMLALVRWLTVFVGALVTLVGALRALVEAVITIARVLSW